MNLLRCLLLLVLVAAASATFGRRWELSSRGRCGLFCGLTRRHYVRPSNSNRKCLGVFGFLAGGVTAKLNLVKDIFGFYSNTGVATSLDIALDTCVNLSRGVALIINKWIEGLGTIFENLIIGLSRLIFCVLGNPWENGNFISRWLTLGRGSAPSICGKEFGLKWGWRRYIYGYSSWDQIIEFYSLVKVRATISSLFKLKAGISIGSLKGTQKVIVDAMLSLCSLLERDYSSWTRSDYVAVTEYMITISAAVGSGYKVGTGITVIEEYTEYLSVIFKKEFNVNIIETMRPNIKQKIKSCDTYSFSGALEADSDIDVGNDSSENVNDNSENNAEENNNSKQDSKNDNNSDKRGGNIKQNDGNQGSENRDKNINRSHSNENRDEQSNSSKDNKNAGNNGNNGSIKQNGVKNAGSSSTINHSNENNNNNNGNHAYKERSDNEVRQNENSSESSRGTSGQGNGSDSTEGTSGQSNGSNSSGSSNGSSGQSSGEKISGSSGGNSGQSTGENGSANSGGSSGSSEGSSGSSNGTSGQSTTEKSSGSSGESSGQSTEENDSANSGGSSGSSEGNSGSSNGSSGQSSEEKSSGSSGGSSGQSTEENSTANNGGSSGNSNGSSGESTGENSSANSDGGSSSYGSNVTGKGNRKVIVKKTEWVTSGDENGDNQRDYNDGSSERVTRVSGDISGENNKVSGIEGCTACKGGVIVKKTKIVTKKRTGVVYDANGRRVTRSREEE